MKSLFLGIGFIVCFHTAYTQNSLNAILTFPKKSGDSQITVTLVVNKPSDLRSYAVFTQHIPEGFFVKPKNIGNAAFLFENNLLTVKWLRLPPEDKFSVSYELSHIKGLTGIYSLAGELTYIVNNKKGTYNLKKQTFSIIQELEKPNENLNDFSYNYQIFQTINAERKITSQVDNSFMIEIRINNLPTENNYILTEEVPSGFNIQHIDAKEATLYFNKKLIQFNIAKPIGNKELILKYKLIPETKNDITSPVIFGKLTFVKNNEIINIPIGN